MLADDLNRCVKIPIPVGAMHLAGARRVSKLTTQIKRPDRFPYLSALRGMAALWVVMVHVAHMPNPHLALPWWAEGFVGNGVMGVNLFFLVSAFSLCLTMPKHDKEERPYLGFMLRRFFRIAPLFYLLIIVTRLMRIFPFRWSALAANIFFVFNFIPGSGYQTAMVLAGWTIGVEMAFYVMFPFIYARTKSVTLAIRALVVAFLVAAAFRSVIGNLVADSASYINQSIFGLAPMFMFGIIAFYMVRAAGEWKHKRVIGALLLSSVLCDYPWLGPIRPGHLLARADVWVPLGGALPSPAQAAGQHGNRVARQYQLFHLSRAQPGNRCASLQIYGVPAPSRVGTRPS